MKFGITTHYFKPYTKDMVELYEGLKKAGYDCIDYSMYDKMFVPHPIFSESREKWVEYHKNARKIIEDNGMSVSQAHAIFPPDFTEGHVRDYCNDYEYDHYKKEIEAASLTGAKYLVVHHHKDGILHNDGLRARAFEKNLEFYNKLLPTFKDCGIKLAIENLFYVSTVKEDTYERSYIATGRDVVDFINYIGDDYVVSCLDSGHANMLGVDIEEFITTVGDKLKVLHLHDNYGKADLHLPPLYGNIDWMKLKSALDKVGYDGVYSMELDGIARGCNVTLEIMLELAGQALKTIKLLWE
ncbi:MAG: sugar phosphate isomerase/epimerase [Clostridia bacterium]|nr:sugar phosphate isomerase/epimerase [Clostridia bacterium]